MRIAFMGTPDFALPALKALIESNHEIVAVYSQPPKPQGRGYQIQKSSIQIFAESQNIPVYTPKSLRSPEEQEFFKNLSLDLSIVAAYGLILPKAILEAPLKGCINIHGSLLPRWRGAAPIQRAIEAGDMETGITIMQMDEGLDTGAMLLKNSTPIDRKNAQELHDELAQMGADLLMETLSKFDQLTPIIQPEEGVTYAHKLKKEQGEINWDQPAAMLEARIRAFTPWPGCYFEYLGEMIKILKARFISYEHNQLPGFVLDNQLTIACVQDALQILELQRPGKKPLKTEEFLRGINIEKGTLLHGNLTLCSDKK
ncbi:MAG: methionyl-tRNA formyltransferase [Alphaproteobacteria bacterium]|nr:methionyl-tRNA formyltransferase [Alphaproteobacteria bacterium]